LPCGFVEDYITPRNQIVPELRRRIVGRTKSHGAGRCPVSEEDRDALGALLGRRDAVEVDDPWYVFD
jgi:hypothetical protein